jgi:hypothetical protein
MNHESPATSPPKPARYVAIRLAVMSAGQHIATAVTHSMAKRIAKALNLYIADRKGE